MNATLKNISTPVVGVVLRPRKTTSGETVYGANPQLLWWLKIKGKASVIGLPLMFGEESPASMKRNLSMCDGIVLPGVQTASNSAEAASAVTQEDSYIVEFLHASNIPTLGICFGSQLMACSSNMSARKPIEGHNLEPSGRHLVRIAKPSKLYDIIGTEEIETNSLHRMEICKDLDSGRKAVGFAQDGVIEAVEDSSKRFFIGVQWHPENMFDEASSRLLEAFVEICRQHI